MYNYARVYFQLVLCWEVCPLSERPLSEVSLYIVYSSRNLLVELLVTLHEQRSIDTIAMCICKQIQSKQVNN